MREISCSVSPVEPDPVSQSNRGKPRFVLDLLVRG